MINRRKTIGFFSFLLAVFLCGYAIPSFIISKPFRGGPMAIPDITSSIFSLFLLPIGLLCYLFGMYLLKFNKLINAIGVVLSGILILLISWSKINVLNQDPHYRTGDLKYDIIYYNDPLEGQIAIFIAVIFIIAGVYLLIRSLEKV